MPDISPEEISQLRQTAQSLRADSLRLIHRRGSGHPGGALSAAEIMAVLYFHAMCIDPSRPAWEERDRFILSKGHASAVLYASLIRRGFFPASELDNWGEVDCPHQGHPDRLKTPGVDMTSGLLGHGVAVGTGMALAARRKGKAWRTYVLLGDGECQGGIVWEGACAAAKFRLDNLTAIIDNNGVQLDGFVDDVMPLGDLPLRWQAAGWNVIRTDGHDVAKLAGAFEEARQHTGSPTVIIARTVKGRGVSYMENQSFWHGNVPNSAQLAQALQELGEAPGG